MTDLLFSLLKAFLVGGCICLIGQLLMDAANLTPAHTMSILVSSGSVAGALGWYDKLSDWAGFGAKLPISSFGNTLTQGAMSGAANDGFLGIFTGMLEPVSMGIAAAVFWGFIIALLFHPQG